MYGDPQYLNIAHWLDEKKTWIWKMTVVFHDSVVDNIGNSRYSFLIH